MNITMQDWINKRRQQMRRQQMTDAKQEALRQALSYHANLLGSYTAAIGEKKPKWATPEQIVATAAKFEKFLIGKKRNG